VFWKLLLGKPTALSDIQGVDPVLHQSLLFVRECPAGEVEGLCLTFTAPALDSDSVAPMRGKGGAAEREVELKAGGKEQAVTADNREEYLELIASHHTRAKMAAQAALVREGLTLLVPGFILRLFSDLDLSTMLTGLPDVSMEEWRNHTIYSSASDSWAATRGLVGRDLIDAPQIRWLWQLVGEMSQQERGLLLRFCTGCSRLGAGGFSSLQPKFAITLVPYDPARALPTAATCFNLLRLPVYPDRVALRKAVTTAMLYGSAGFTFC
jgi:hypothetical protein